jgi:hypothetical protein
MTIDLPAPRPAPPHEETLRFAFRAGAASNLLASARTLLAAAPRELSESFEQAVRGAGIAS